MNEAQTVAIAKALKSAAVKNASSALDVGEHELDFWAHFVGSMKKFQDEECTPTKSVPYKRAFAALYYVAGCTGKHGINMMRKAMEIALADESDETAKAALERICPTVERIEREVVDPMLQSLPKIKSLGKVTTKLDVEIVERP